MQKLISKYGLAAHLALLAVAPLIVFPYLQVTDIAKVILWLSLLAFAWFLNAPSRINKERSTSEARRRITGALRVDPVFWILVIVSVIAGIRALNNGITLAYDAENYIWFLTEPTISVLPASSEAAGLPSFATALLSLMTYIIAGHALGKSARVALGFLVGLLAGIAGYMALYELVIGNEMIGNLAKCVIDNPSFFGIGFGLALIIIVSALPSAFERKWNVALAIFPVAIGGTVATLFAFSPAYMASGYFSAALIVLAYGIFWTFKRLGKSTALKVMVVFGFSLLIAAVVIYGTSFKIVLDKLSSLTLALLTASEADISSKLTSISMKVWKTKLWLGSGLGTFSTQFRFNATDADWAVVSIQQLSPINAWSYLLMERGIIGALIWAVPSVAFLWGYVNRVIKAVKELPSPLVLAGPLAALVAFSLCAFNTSLFRIEAFPLVILAVALSTNSWVKEKIDGQ